MPKNDISRRQSMALGIGAMLATLTGASAGSGVTPQRKMSPKSLPVGQPRVQIESELDGISTHRHIHDGKGEIAVKYFDLNEFAQPANFLIYDMPPKSSEGVHTHKLNDPQAGSFDEFYYIVEGEGQMEIDGERYPVSPGDHIFTPINVPHGIENLSEYQNLKVLLTFILR